MEACETHAFRIFIRKDIFFLHAPDVERIYCFDGNISYAMQWFCAGNKRTYFTIEIFWQVDDFEHDCVSNIEIVRNIEQRMLLFSKTQLKPNIL